MVFKTNFGLLFNGRIRQVLLYHTLLDDITDCGGLRKPVHGLVNVSGETTLGNIASYYCEPGFDLIGHQNRACGTNGTWSGVPPICQPKGRYCTRPHSGETTLGNIASYYCEPGFDLIGHQNRACGTNGTWSGVPPICQPKGRYCTRPHSGETTLGNIASYYCEPGFDLIGHQNRACGTDGTWSRVPPICQPKGRYCTRPHSGETTLGNIASYYCEPGFDLIGHQNRACGTDGTWSGVPPICQPKGRYCTRPPGKIAYWKIIFFISHPKHILCVVKRTVSISGSAVAQW